MATRWIYRFRRLVIAAALMVAFLPGVGRAFTIDIQAVIDGRDQLIIQGDTLQWHHFEKWPVGLHIIGAGPNDPVPDFPTVITTPAMNQVEWYPVWPQWAIGSDIEAYSSVFSGLTPMLPADGLPVTLTVITARGAVSVLEQPNAANNYTFVLEFNDVPIGSAAWYEVQLDIPEVPVPPSALLLGTGLLGLAVWGRRGRDARK
jgi:hypothetical protein